MLNREQSVQAALYNRMIKAMYLLDQEHFIVPAEAAG